MATLLRPTTATVAVLLAFTRAEAFAFTATNRHGHRTDILETRAPSATIASELAMTRDENERRRIAPPSRRSFLSSASAAALSIASAPIAAPSALAAEVPPLEECLYSILRAKEATAQETRLIKSGKFKDVQRANVKLAVKFIVNNYRLSDNFIAAAGTLSGNSRIRAGEIGQSVVQNLYTILEYFDSSDVENIKVGVNSMAGKEGIVLSGLDAARKGIDSYLSYFPSDVVDKVKAKIQQENDLNEKEFDTSLGPILNPSPKI